MSRLPVIRPEKRLDAAKPLETRETLRMVYYAPIKASVYLVPVATQQWGALDYGFLSDVGKDK